MKNRIKLFVVIIIAITMLVSSASAAAAPPVTQPNTKLILANNIRTIETELNAKHSNVVTLLKNQITNYQRSLYSEVNEAKRDQLKGLISGTYQLLSSYINYRNNTNGNNPTPNGIYDDIYSPAVAAVVAWFLLKGYDLAAELLTHATLNNSTTDVYYPYYGYKVANSWIYLNIVMYAPYGSGSGCFPNSGSTDDKDLYYAIHGFNFLKITNSIVITDRYDYELSDMGGLEGIAVNTMYYAQVIGVIVPYDVVIN